MASPNPEDDKNKDNPGVKHDPASEKADQKEPLSITTPSLPANTHSRSDEHQTAEETYWKLAVRWQKIGAIATIAAFAAAAVYVCYERRQVRVAIAANEISEKQFRLSNRPWIGLVADRPVQIDREIHYTDGKTIEFVGKFNIQNYGTSVAVNTVTLGDGMSTDPEIACHRGFSQNKDGMKETCDAGRKFATGEILTIPPSHEKLGIVLFPNQTATAMLEVAADLGTKRPVNVAITGCAVYVDQREELHETQFCIEAMFDGQRFEPWASCNVCNEAE